MKSSSEGGNQFVKFANQLNFDFFRRDIVDAAHLKSLSKEDKMNAQTTKSRWNSSI